MVFLAQCFDEKLESGVPLRLRVSQWYFSVVLAMRLKDNESR
jgi:hypothetical protein